MQSRNQKGSNRVLRQLARLVLQPSYTVIYEGKEIIELPECHPSQFNNRKILKVSTNERVLRISLENIGLYATPTVITHLTMLLVKLLSQVITTYYGI